MGIGLHRADGLYLSGTSSAGGHQGRSEAGEGEPVLARPPSPSRPAEYTVSAAAWTGDATPSHRLSQAARFAVRPPPPGAGRGLVLSPTWEAGGALSLPAVPAVEDDTLRERPAGFRAGDAAD